MWSTEQILFAIVAILLAYYLYFVYDPRYFARMGVKGPFPLPFMGTMFTVLRKGFLQYSVDIRRNYGKVAGAFEGTVPMLLISDPDLIQQLLVKDFNTFPNRKVMNPGDGVTDLFLTALQDDHWRHVRHITSPAFSTGKLKQMMSDINDCAKLLETSLRNQAKDGGKVVNMKDCCGQFTMDVIARTGFGMEVDTQKNPDSPFVVYAKKIFDIKFFNPGAIIFFFFPVFRPLLRRVGFSLFPQDTIDFFRDVALKALDRKEGEQRDGRVDFLQLMVKARNEQKASETQTADNSIEKLTTTSRKGLTEDEAVAQAVLFLLAGYETTASTLSFVLYKLALHPEYQEKLYNEVINVVGDKTEIDFETTNNFTYMDQCIQEALRLYPPFTRTDRQAVADTMLGDLHIRKGQFVSAQIYALHYDPDYWPDPETFNPDRFSAEAVASHHPCQYLPFSIGPRMCVGMRLAQVVLRVGLAHLIKHFRFTRCPETEVPLAFRPVGLLQTKHPIRLKVELRS